jgi:hypothetical protein
MSWEVATLLLGGISTLAIYSVLFFQENRFFRFFEHLYIGIAAGFLSVYTIQNFLWPKILEPLFGLDIVTFPDGTVSKPYELGLLLYIVPIFFGLLYYCSYIARLQWLSKLTIGITLGFSGALAIKGFFSEMLPQITGSFKPLIVMQAGNIAWTSSIENILFIAILLTVMNYFFFTIRRGASADAGASAAQSGKLIVLGRWLMMLSFGAFFGSTVMARLALLIERLNFMIGEWWPALKGLFVS